MKIYMKEYKLFILNNLKLGNETVIGGCHDIE